MFKPRKRLKARSDSAVAKLKRECHDLWSAAVKLRHGNKSVLPPHHRLGLDGCHIFPCTRATTCYRIENGVPATRLEHNHWHDNPHEFTEFIKKWWPYTHITYDELERESLKMTSVTEDFLLTTRAHLQDALRTMRQHSSAVATLGS